MPKADRDAFQRCGMDYLILFNALGSFYMNNGQKKPNVTFKAHYVAHVLLEAKFFNPIFGWCYAGEDFMNASKRLMAASVIGCSPLAACKKIVVGIE